MKGASAEEVTGFRVRKVSPPPRFTLRPLLATSPQLVLEKAASRVLAHLCHTRLFISLPTDEEEEEDGPMHEDRLWTLTQATRLLSVTQTGATSSLHVAPVGSRGLPWAPTGSLLLASVILRLIGGALEQNRPPLRVHLGTETRAREFKGIFRRNPSVSRLP